MLAAVTADKQAVRERVWRELQRRGAARFPGAEGRIPNFTGAEAAARLLASLKEWQAADVLKSNPVDLVVCGTVAVNRRGVRVGKGGGYSDLEFALLSESGAIDDRTVVVTTVHPVQMLDENLVSLEVDEDQCVIRVVDTGRGFDSQSLGFRHANNSAEEGRGIELMRALVDQVRFISKPEAGTVVRLEKTLEFENPSFVRRTRTGSRT